MERENIGLYRGRSSEVGWIEGFYAEFSGKPFIGVPDPSGTMMWYAVIPETVGQFTGQTVGGKKLFEGDIVRYKNKDGTPAHYQTVMDEKIGAWVFKWLEGPGTAVFVAVFCNLVEIIGNGNDMSLSTFTAAPPTTSGNDEKTASGLLEE